MFAEKRGLISVLDLTSLKGTEYLNLIYNDVSPARMIEEKAEKCNA